MSKKSLRTVNGFYVRALAAGSGILDAGASVPHSWEEFVVEDLGNHYLALKAVNGKYVRAVEGGELRPDRDVCGLHERFLCVKLPDNQIAIQCFNGKYWSAIDGGGAALLAIADVVDAWEAFTIVTP